MIATSSYIAPFSKSILSNFLVVKTSSFSICTEMFTSQQSKRECGRTCNQALISYDALRSAVQPPLMCMQLLLNVVKLGGNAINLWFY